MNSSSGRHHGEKGQILVLGLIAMIILLLAIIIFFDVQSVARIKIKSQNALDASALAGAKWQQESLNMIGELNIIKATTVLITDFVGASPNSYMSAPNPADLPTALAQRDYLESVAGLLTQTQARVSFVGPMVGYGAAQQAAMQNGLSYNDQYGVATKDLLARLLFGYVNDTLPSTYMDYSWQSPYYNMLLSIYAEGKGIAVNNRNKAIFGNPRLTSEPITPFLYLLQSKSFYYAINSNAWCYLRDDLRRNFSAGWWGKLELAETPTVVTGAEYLPLGVTFNAESNAYNTMVNNGFLQYVTDHQYSSTALPNLRTEYDAHDAWLEDSITKNWYRNSLDTDDKFDPLPLIRWALYDSSVWGTRSESNIETWENWFRSSVKDGYTYYGPIAQMESEITPVTLSGNMKNLTGSSEYLGDALRFGNSGTSIGSDYNRQASRIKNVEYWQRNRFRQRVEAYATAKVFGRLQTDDGYFRPHYSSVVLPVFDKVALIPRAWESRSDRIDSFDSQFYYFLTEFLPVLGTTDDLADIPGLMSSNEHWQQGMFDGYYNALQKINDPSWRQKGIDWLETVNTNPDTGEQYTNEDTCDDWPSGGSSGGTVTAPSSGL